jgi:hypothetical protein
VDYSFSRLPPYPLAISDFESALTDARASLFPHPNSREAGHVVGIDFPEGGGPALKVISRSNLNPTGVYPSYRTGKQVVWDSPHEYNLIRLMDCDASVVDILPQPCVIRYVQGGEERKHYPDLLTKLQNGQKVFWEVKTPENAHRTDTRSRTAIMAEGLTEHGYLYRVALSDDLRVEPRLKNVTQLLRHGRKRVPIEVREQIRQLMTLAKAISLGQVASGALGPLNRATAYNLVLEGKLWIDVDAHWNQSTLLHWVA